MPNTANPKTPHADKDTNPDKRSQHPADKGQTHDSTRDPSGSRHGAGQSPAQDRSQANDPTGGARNTRK